VIAMEGIKEFLLWLRNNIWKTLPMKEEEDRGADNHLSTHISAVVERARGAMALFPELKQASQYLAAVTRIGYLLEVEDMPFAQYRAIVLSSTRLIGDLYKQYENEVEEDVGE